MDFKISKKLKRQLKEDSAKIPPQANLALEALELLVSSYFFKGKIPDSNNIIENFETMKFIQLLHNDIILRLCKFADDDSRSWSFAQALKKIRKRSNFKIPEEELSIKIKKYREIIRNIANHRNAYIAHLSKRDRTFLKPPDLFPLIKMAVEILDDLSGKRKTYKFLDIDLRQELFGENMINEKIDKKS